MNFDQMNELLPEHAQRPLYQLLVVAEAYRIQRQHQKLMTVSQREDFKYFLHHFAKAICNGYDQD
jgi:hypothetical protein